MAKGGGNGGGNGNKAPTAIYLSNTIVAENIGGAVGVLTGSDPNKRKNAYAERFWADLQAEWEVGGRAVIKRVMAEEPAKFLLHSERPRGGSSGTGLQRTGPI